MVFLFTGCNEKREEVQVNGKQVPIGLIFTDNDTLMHNRLKVFELFQKYWGRLDNGDQLYVHVVSANGDALKGFNHLLKKENLSVIISF